MNNTTTDKYQEEARALVRSWDEKEMPTMKMAYQTRQAEDIANALKKVEVEALERHKIFLCSCVAVFALVLFILVHAALRGGYRPDQYRFTPAHAWDVYLESREQTEEIKAQMQRELGDRYGVTKEERGE